MFEWGNREVWGDGYVRDELRGGEDDARARVEYFQRQKDRGRVTTTAELRLIKRPVGNWEEVTD